MLSLALSAFSVGAEATSVASEAVGADRVRLLILEVLSGYSDYISISGSFQFRLNASIRSKIQEGSRSPLLENN